MSNKLTESSAIFMSPNDQRRQSSMKDECLQSLLFDSNDAQENVF